MTPPRTSRSLQRYELNREPHKARKKLIYSMGID